MADDTMEISSEHGHNIGDEDIDIDIDFTAGHIDEDDVLEDAASNAGFEEDFRPQPFPAMGHDDLMVDEDEESFPMPMDGEDFMQDEDNHPMEQEPLGLSFTPADVPVLLVDENSSGDISHVVVDGEMKESEVTWETNDEPQQETQEADLHLEDTEEDHQESPVVEGHHEEPEEEYHESHEEHEDVRDSTATEENEAPPGTNLHGDSNSDSPHNSSIKDSAVVEEEPRNPPTGITAPALGSPDHEPEHSGKAIGTSAVSQDIVHSIEHASTDDLVSTPSSQEVIVVYRDSEYSLFSKSETDDIDSYFLSDLSIKDKPLFDFFEAIRDVIRGDLIDEEELCLAVEDLGLEVEEVSCFSANWQPSALTAFGQMSSSLAGDITLGQIINLHEKLLQNDGIESTRPLCLTLTTRPRFSTRYANLISGATEGKGLSELLQLDEEHSETFDESAHVTDNEHGEEVDTESYDADEVAEQQESDLPQQEGSDDTLANEPTAEQEPPEVETDVRSENASRTAATNGFNAVDDSIALPTDNEEVQPSQKIEASGNSEYDEDGDLIDYSDEEDNSRAELRRDANSRPSKLKTDDTRTYNGTFTDFIPPCLTPNTCFCSKCNDLLLAEYEAINEELRRRSISRTAEDNLLKQVAEGNEDEERGHETTLETENGIEYNENDGEAVEPNNLTAELGDQSADFGEDDAVELGNHEDEFFIEDSEEGGEMFEGHDPTSETIVAAGQENFDEFDFGENDETEQLLPELGDPEATSHHNDNALENEQTAALAKETFSTGSSLGFADAVDSESAASEKTLEAQRVAIDNLQTEFNEENEDEIDYDDDEELDALEVQELVAKELQTPNGGSGKRQRTDDDGTSMGSKGMYKHGLKKTKIC